VDDQSGKRFEALARQACSDLEAGALDAQGVLKMLNSLVGAALSFPEVEPSDQEYADPHDLGAACRTVSQNVVHMVKTDLYWEVFDPRHEESPVAGSLTDDLTDIYRDLRRGLAIADSGSMIDAVWEWRYNYEIHWGNHATDAIRVLHRIIDPEP
jgi:hypothetical protein